MTDTVTNLFESGFERYQAGEDAESLIPVFQEICDRSPKMSAAWSSLAWLYLLTERADLALKAAQKAVKLDANAPQARVNLVLAMLETGKKGVREHIEVAQQMASLDPQVRSDLQENIQDGFNRKSDWKSLKKVEKWLFGESE
ncbi:tetratricopeptide repeat protein [Oscillatoria salina]|uniref:tetratricopeptide repeat protein n=1 Tax=Oscillatoria salina TaxID=331517 RepID=UPI0013B8095C|nr:hypothetical protein [Oscillatoria salina]MBZ8181816.1 hypothetical protein [Oscillatoria salina IIICB1]NET87036.1 hypothetical protein [Kamptonema sp. SIO1D9]